MRDLRELLSTGGTESSKSKRNERTATDSTKRRSDNRLTIGRAALADQQARAAEGVAEGAAEGGEAQEAQASSRPGGGRCVEDPPLGASVGAAVGQMAGGSDKP